MEYDDPRFLSFVKDLAKAIEVSTTLSIVGFVPWLVKILPNKLLRSDIPLQTIESFNGYAAVSEITRQSLQSSLKLNWRTKKERNSHWLTFLGIDQGAPSIS